MSALPALAIVPTPKARLARPVASDYVYLATHMRPDEIAQQCALLGIPVADYDADAAARLLCAQGEPEFVLVDADGYPAAAGGFDYLRPGVFECWAVGTMDGWDAHWRAITRHCRGHIDSFLQTHAHRVQTVALASRTGAHEWYERGLGMQPEGVLRGFFSDGQDGVMFAKTRSQ